MTFSSLKKPIILIEHLNAKSSTLVQELTGINITINHSFVCYSFIYTELFKSFEINLHKRFFLLFYLWVGTEEEN